MSRKENIIRDAITASDIIIDRSGTEVIRSHARRISQIAEQFLRRDFNEMIEPTAAAVHEAGGPSRSSIYNRHRHVLAVWRNAYRDIKDLKKGTIRSAAQQLSDIDASTFDSGSRAVIEMLRQRINQLDHQYKMLMQQFTSSIPYGLEEEQADLLEGMQDFLNQVRAAGFLLDDQGLRVTHKTPIGTLIMTRRLFDQLVQTADTLRVEGNVRP